MNCTHCGGPTVPAKRRYDSKNFGTILKGEPSPFCSRRCAAAYAATARSAACGNTTIPVSRERQLELDAEEVAAELARVA